MRYGIWLALIPLVFFLATAGWAESAIPDLKGTWEVKSSGSGFEKPGETELPLLHTEKLGFHEIEFTMVIERQDGFRFAGYRESKRKKEPLCGVIGYDNKSLYMADNDGMMTGTLVSPDRLEIIYLHVNRHHSVASREVMTRKK